MTARATNHFAAAVLGLVLFVVAAALALSVDVPRTSYGLKSDEATYIAATLSAAYDGDLSFSRRDLERFAGLYHSGPDGVFLKRGKEMRIRVRTSSPFLHVSGRQDPDTTRLYFGKALVYPLFAAPFVRVFGLNGILLSHVVLLGMAGAATYLFLAAQGSTLRAMVLGTAFFGASVLPVYSVFLMPEIFNFTLVLLAYFLWLYKEVAPASRLSRPWTDFVAALLLGIGTYSKPLPTPLLVAPLVLLPWLRRRWLHGFAVGATAVLVAGALFGFNAAVSGEFNYQGGERRTFYGSFPFDRPENSWQSEPGAGTTGTDGDMQQLVLTSPEAPRWFLRNLTYFTFGRHFGFVPYFFPGAVAILAWLLSGARRESWRVLVFLAFLGSTVALLLVLPFTWSGGGGPPGNRYFFTAYPVLLFLVPPGLSVTPGVLAWIGGALFTAKMLVNPFVAAKFPYLTVEKGPARRLPVELTMANDLPVRLAQPLRGRVQYRTDPGVLLYHLDQNSWPPEPNGMWISGSGRSDIIVRAPFPIEYMEFEAESPVPTVITIALGGAPITVALQPRKVATFSVPARGVRGFGDFDYLLTTHSTEGFVPHLLEPANGDYRNLGAQLRFRPVTPTEASSRTSSLK
jgi:hypothetical protein